jgi:tRNA(adenine34) deaminase
VAKGDAVVFGKKMMKKSAAENQNAKSISLSQTNLRNMAQIDSSSLAFQRGASAASKRSLLDINEHCERGRNKAENQNAKSIYWMQHALRLANHATLCGEVPVGAVLVADDGTLLGEGWNCPISSCDPSAHAEIIALRKAAKTLQNYRLVKTTLYVTLEPCIMCVGAMIQARIARLVFGANDPKAGAIVSVFNLLDEVERGKLNHKIAYSSGILADECAEMLRRFFQERRGDK